MNAKNDFFDSENAMLFICDLISSILLRIIEPILFTFSETFQLSNPNWNVFETIDSWEPNGIVKLKFSRDYPKGPLRGILTRVCRKQEKSSLEGRRRLCFRFKRHRKTY